MHTKIITRLSLLASVLVVPACGGSNDSGLFVDWQIEDVGPPINDTVSCDEAGAATVVLEATNATRGTPAEIFNVPCASGSLTTTPLASGTYNVNLRLLRSDNVEVSSIALPPIGVRRSGVSDLGTVVFEIQSFQSQWIVTKSTAPQVAVSCTSVGATTVEFTAASVSPGAAPFVFRFPCGPGLGVTQAIPDDTYNLTFRLLDAGGNPLSVFGPMAFTTPVGTPAVLPQITFTVN
ncbi:MAG: hypothetical protein SF187_02580 [Deltaproteobacteria bacterium]|nr:hypothetical protein [Deltaproteobacteria bacterium]